MPTIKPISYAISLLFFNHKHSLSIDDQFYLQIKRQQLKTRVANACRDDNTNYEIHLRDFCANNKNNLRLLTQVAGYRRYLIGTGCTAIQAAKETLEHFRH